MADGGAFYAASSFAPEIPERLGGKRRVADRVPNVLMTQIVLDRLAIVELTQVSLRVFDVCVQSISHIAKLSAPTPPKISVYVTLVTDRLPCLGQTARC